MPSTTLTTAKRPAREPATPAFEFPRIKVVPKKPTDNIMLLEFALKALKTDFHCCQKNRNELNKVLDRILDFRKTRSKLFAKTQPPAYLENLVNFQSKAASAHEDYVQLANLADKSVAALDTNQTQTIWLARCYAMVAAGKAAELWLAGTAIARGATEFKEQFKRALDVKDNIEIAANTAKTIGSAAQGRTTDGIKDGAAALFGLLNKLVPDIKAIASLVIAGDKVRQGKTTSWTDFTTWLSKLCSALENLLLTLNLIYKKVKKLTDDTRLKKLAPLISPLTKLIELIDNAMKARKEFKAAKKGKEELAKTVRHRDQLKSAKTSMKSQAWLLMFTSNLEAMLKGIDEKSISLNYVSKIKNGADAKAWSKSLTDRLARVQQELRNARSTFEQKRGRFERDLRALPGLLRRFRITEQTMIKNYRYVLRHNFSSAPKAYKKIANEFARQVYWCDIANLRYQDFRGQVGKRSTR